MRGAEAIMNSVLIRCQSCGSVNKVLKEKIQSKPRCGKCKTKITIPNRSIDISSGDFRREVLSDPGTVLLEFWSPTCGHCLRLNSVLDQIAAEKAGLLKVLKVNIQNDQHLAYQFGIRGVPTMMLYRGGKKLNEISGALPKQQLEAWIHSTVAL